MKRFCNVFLACCLTLLGAHTANAGGHTAQQLCNFARAVAWKNYQTCIDKYVGVWSEGVSMAYVINPDKGFQRCRNTYFRKWTSFQARASLASSDCVGSRFTDNGNGTVTDHLTNLVWEKKTNLDSSPNYADPHDADNAYSWTTGTNDENGTLFTQFLSDPASGLNTTGFAGSYGWRIPTVTELQTLLLDIPCRSCDCQSIASVCIDPIFLPDTPQLFYWSSTTYIDPYSPAVDYAWGVGFYFGYPDSGLKTYNGGAPARAVRGGL